MSINNGTGSGPAVRPAALNSLTRGELFGAIAKTLGISEGGDILAAIDSLHRRLDDAEIQRNIADNACKRAAARAEAWREEAEAAQALVERISEPCGICGGKGVVPDAAATTTGVSACFACGGQGRVRKGLMTTFPVGVATISAPNGRAVINLTGVGQPLGISIGWDTAAPNPSAPVSPAESKVDRAAQHLPGGTVTFCGTGAGGYAATDPVGHGIAALAEALHAETPRGDEGRVR